GGLSHGADATSAKTSITINASDVAGLIQTGQFDINGTNIVLPAVPAPATPAELKAALETAVQDAFPGATASYNGTTLLVTYPAGLRTPIDTTASGVSTSISASGDIDSALAAMQNNLRSLTGDDTLF